MENSYLIFSLMSKTILGVFYDKCNRFLMDCFLKDDRVYRIQYSICLMYIGVLDYTLNFSFRCIAIVFFNV